MVTAGFHLDFVNMDIHVLELVRTSMLSWQRSSDLFNDVDIINFDVVLNGFKIVI